MKSFLITTLLILSGSVQAQDKCHQTIFEAMNSAQNLGGQSIHLFAEKKTGKPLFEPPPNATWIELLQYPAFEERQKIVDRLRKQVDDLYRKALAECQQKPTQ